jgi:hypothetical protein
VFENGALRRIVGLRDEVKMEWRKLHNQELNDLYSSLNSVFSPHCHHMSLMDFVVFPPGCYRSVTDF